MNKNLAKKIITGKTSDHLTYIPTMDVYIHKDIRDDFFFLHNEAKKNNIEITIASGFRSFEKQKLIWNEKASGKRALFDEHGNIIDYNLVKDNQEELLYLILNWSAIPGMSRHHWGTDIDVFDMVPLMSEPTYKDYKVQLIDNETRCGGIFEKMHLWLDLEINSDSDKCAFFRPYNENSRGVKSERWHLSHKKIAQQFEQALSFDLFIEHLNESNDLLLKDFIIKNADEIFFNFISINN